MPTNNHQVLAGKTILIAEDDPRNRRAIIQLFANWCPSTEILMALDGQQCLDIMAQRLVDLILLDWDMPRMDGLELLQELQKEKYLPYKNIPIVVYTGAMTDSLHLAKALEYGAIDFLRKPAPPVELLARIKSILKQKEWQQQMKAAEAEVKALQLKQLQKDLQQLLLVLAHKNELLLELKAKIEDPNTQRQRLLREINQLIEAEDYWLPFLQQFQQMEPDYQQKLMQIVPDISPAELRLAVLIRADLDSKSIAQLLNISLHGVKKSRYRIRKKLDLQTNDSLDKFLKNI